MPSDAIVKIWCGESRRTRSGRSAAPRRSPSRVAKRVTPARSATTNAMRGRIPIYALQPHRTSRRWQHAWRLRAQGSITDGFTPAQTVCRPGDPLSRSPYQVSGDVPIASLSCLFRIRERRRTFCSPTGGLRGHGNGPRNVSQARDRSGPIRPQERSAPARGASRRARRRRGRSTRRSAEQQHAEHRCIVPYRTDQ